MSILARLFLFLILFSIGWVHAAEPQPPSPADGIYKPTSLSAYVYFAGRKINLPLGAVREAFVRDGLIPIRDRRIPIRRPQWELVLERMNFLGIDGNATVFAPDNLVFKGRNNRKSTKFYGRTSYPLRVKMKGRYKFIPVTVTLQTNLNSKIDGDNLLIDSPLTINVSGVVTAKGRLRIAAKRKDIDFRDLR